MEGGIVREQHKRNSAATGRLNDAAGGAAGGAARGGTGGRGGEGGRVAGGDGGLQQTHHATVFNGLKSKPFVRVANTALRRPCTQSSTCGRGVASIAVNGLSKHTNDAAVTNVEYVRRRGRRRGRNIV